MSRLYLVPKQVPPSYPAMRSAVAGPLQQLAAIDRAAEKLQRACATLAQVTDRAAQASTKLQRGAATFLVAWNAAHPEQKIQRCRGAATEATCTRYTTNAQALCDACRAQRIPG